jgi:molybdopterin molybdotransferase
MPLISFEEARNAVLAHTATLDSEIVPIASALGCCLSAPFAARIDNPAFDNSAVDGYAVRAADAVRGTCLPLQSVVSAGSPAPELQPGYCIAIYTGARLPQGADAVVMQEDVERRNGEVLFQTSPKVGEFVRRQGEEYRTGDSLLPLGTPVSPAVIALLASNGSVMVPAYRHPKVRIVSTGSELAEPGETRGDNHVFDGNGSGLVAAIRALGVREVSLSRVPDSHELLHTAFTNALAESDVIISSGGVSVGERDLVKAVWAELGVEQVFWQVSIRPGKPLFFGVGHGKLVFGLPGNPVSALVCFHLFCRPALLKLMGYGHETLSPVLAKLQGPAERQTNRTDFQRGMLADGKVQPLPGQWSNFLAGLASCNCLIRVPPGPSPVPGGHMVDVYPMHWGAPI